MLEQILLQVATQPTPTGSDPLVNLIMAIGILLGAIGTVVGIISTNIAKFATGKAKEAAEQVQKVGEYAVETSKSVVNNEQKIKGVANVMYNLSPAEARVLLDKYNITLEQLADDAHKTTEQLNKLGEFLPVEVNLDANHNGIPDRIEELDTELGGKKPGESNRTVSIQGNNKTAPEAVEDLNKAVDGVNKRSNTTT